MDKGDILYMLITGEIVFLHMFAVSAHLLSSAVLGAVPVASLKGP